MKTLCVLALVLCCVSLAVAEVNRCEKNEDCDEGECCVRMSKFLPAKCRKLQKEFHLCFPNEESHLGDGFYHYMCPCAEGLKCEAKEQKEGSKTYGGGNCRKV
ncbi:prokineticin domain-containing protein [Trichonephila clavata]|uniref:Prokineticin domain-containing protein n=1 Tax=Trichonephila clavata TaxID=2740835 RepID=A0A8X6HAD2_TRICU|nr:prokineticin domain-containing protein [Trichonephila clavata]